MKRLPATTKIALKPDYAEAYSNPLRHFALASSSVWMITMLLYDKAIAET
jgi:hypothetical protein